MRGCMADIQSATAEIRRGKKKKKEEEEEEEEKEKEKEKEEKKPHGKNIMSAPIT